VAIDDDDDDCLFNALRPGQDVLIIGVLFRNCGYSPH
jgi:hypothetical protein